jgi:hypothetical protein
MKRKEKKKATKENYLKNRVPLTSASGRRLFHPEELLEENKRQGCGLQS